MSDKTMGYDLAIEVRRSDSGMYEISGDAEVESVEELFDAGLTFGDPTPLQGWGEWEAAVSAVDDEGCVRHYFLAREVLSLLDALDRAEAELESERVEHRNCAKSLAALLRATTDLD